MARSSGIAEVVTGLPRPQRELSRRALWSTLARRRVAALTNVAFLVVAILMVFPVFWAVATALKPEPQIVRYPPIWIPIPPSFAGYAAIAQDGRMARYIFNSLFTSLTSVVIVVVLASLAGYAFSRFRFRGRSLLLGFLLATIMLPGLTQVVPIYWAFSRIHWINTYQALITLYSAAGLPFSIWIVKSFFDAIPVELEDAALIDGCGWLQLLFRIVLPIAAPGAGAVATLHFVGAWNDFFTPLIFTTSDTMHTATVGLYDFMSFNSGGSYNIQYQFLAAAAVIVMIPPIILFLLARRVFMRGMLEGAIKS